MQRLIGTAAREARRHGFGIGHAAWCRGFVPVVAVMLCGATLTAGCIPSRPACPKGDESFRKQAATARESVAAAAELLGLDPSTIEEEPFPSKDRWGNDDPSAKGLEVRVLGQKKGIPDFSPVVAKWKADWSLVWTNGSDDDLYFEHEGIEAELGYSWDAEPDGTRNVWAQVSTDCFPVAETDEG